MVQQTETDTKETEESSATSKKFWPLIVLAATATAGVTAWFGGVLDLPGKLDSILGMGDPELSIADATLVVHFDIERVLKCVTAMEKTIDPVCVASSLSGPPPPRSESEDYDLSFALHKKYGVRVNGCSIQLSNEGAVQLIGAKEEQKFELDKHVTGVVEKKIVRLVNSPSKPVDVQVVCDGAVSNKLTATKP